MRNLFMILAILVAGQKVSAQASLTPEQLKLMEGTWAGDLLVTNPKTQEQRSLKTDYAFTAVGQRRWRVGHGSPGLPASSNLRSWALSDDGRECNGQTVEQVEQFAPDSMRFTLVSEGMESATQSRIRMVYIVGPRTCIIRKEVLPMAEAEKGTASYVVRQEYRLHR